MSAEPFVPRNPTLPRLRAAAARCTGCDLYRRATQTVFGEGPSDARVMLVGEQPGHEEDLAGRPFVGPAGRLLVVDFAPHELEFLRDQHAHRRLGFAPEMVDKMAEAFRTGRGVGWHEHDPGLFEGTRRFFRPGYVLNLVGQWIPSLEGMQQRLEAGGRVADVGCGHGASTILMAKAFPNSKFIGYDYHAPSIERARKANSEGKAVLLEFITSEEIAFSHRRAL